MILPSRDGGTPMKPMCTMADVARLAGVSTSTVSRALRPGNVVAAVTRKRVSQAVEKLGYIPDYTAGTLSSGRSGLIGFIVPSLNSPDYEDVANGLLSALNPLRAELFIATSNRSASRAEELIEMMLRRRVEAFAISGHLHTDRSINIFRSSGVPVVNFSNSGGVLGFEHSVSLNLDALARALIRHLIARSRKSIVVFAPTSASDPGTAARAQSMLGRMGDSGAQAITLVEFSESDAPMRQGARAMRDLLATRPAVDAVVCPNDHFAYGALEHCQSAGVHVPDDVSIVGFGDDEVSMICKPSITTVSVNYQAIGTEVGKILVERLSASSGHSTVPPYRCEANFEIIIREST